MAVVALRGSMYRSFQSDGENGERRVVALRGASVAEVVMGERCMDGGIRSRRRPWCFLIAPGPEDVGPVPVAVAGGGGSVADLTGGSRSWNPKVPLTALAGCEVVVDVGVGAEVGP